MHLIPPLATYGVISVTTDPVRGAGWYGPTTGLHTVVIQVQNFQGRITIEATIATDPGDDDWFNVMPEAAPYWQYPHSNYIFGGEGAMGESSTLTFNFQTNAVWVRSVIDRSYLIPPMTTSIYEISTFGLVNYILLNY